MRNSRGRKSKPMKNKNFGGSRGRSDDFNPRGRPNRHSGNSSGGGRSSGRGFGSGRGPEMHRVTCDKCGTRCEVPFKPSGDKPVLCSDCFGSKGGDSRSRSGGRGGRSSGGDRQLDEINRKLDKIMEALDLD